MKKNWYASKTLWVSSVSFIGVAASIMFADPEVAARIKEGGALLVPVLMFALRFVTSDPVR